MEALPRYKNTRAYLSKADTTSYTQVVNIPCKIEMYNAFIGDLRGRNYKYSILTIFFTFFICVICPMKVW